MYDVIIIGGGPAGMTAGIYAIRANLKVLILEKESIGGQIASSPLVQNYPGFISISGAELANNLYEQVVNLGVDFELEEVLKLEDGKTKKVITDCNTYETKTIIIATGSKYRLLGLPNENELIGNGIHFCTSCDGSFYKDKTVAVIGGANSAVTNALYLSDICKKVYLIYRKDKLRCEAELDDLIKARENTEIIFNTVVNKIIGEKNLTAIEIKTGDKLKRVKLDGMFVSVGMDAQTEVATDLITKNDHDYIVSENCMTNVPGIFVAGDCREKEIRQLTTAVADGTMAATAAINYLK